VTILDSTSLPLGVRHETIVPTLPPITLQPGELIVLFTDGVYEAESPSHERFGVPRALELVRRRRDKPARLIVDELAGEISKFTRGLPQRDDITMVVVKVEEAD